MKHHKTKAISVCTAACLAFFSVPLLAATNGQNGEPKPHEGGTDASTIYWRQSYLSIADPIMANSGQYYFEMPLLDLGGPLPLQFTLRHRASQPPSEGLPFRGHFQHTLDPEVSWNTFDGPENPRITVFLRNYELLAFGWNTTSNRWDLDVTTPTRYQLHETGASPSNGWYCVTDPVKEHVYLFEKNPENASSQWAQSRVRYKMDRGGNTHTYTYLSGNRGTLIDTITDGLGRSFEFQYDGSTLTNIVDQAGRNIRFIHEADAPDAGTNDVLRAVVDPGGGTSTFHYANFEWDSPVAALEHPLGNMPYTQTFANVVLNTETNVRTTSQTDAYGNATLLGYEAQSNQVTETRADGITVVYQHHGNHAQPRSLQDAAGRAVAYTQNATRQVDSITDRMGDTTTIGYHAPSGKIASYRDAGGNLHCNTYATVSQVFINPANGESYTNAFYDLVRRDYPDSTHETFGYDGLGNPTGHVDRAGHTWSYTYNSRGQVLAVTGPEGGTTSYTYNPDATLASRTDSDTGVTTYNHDPSKRLTGFQRPDGASAGWAYDRDDRMTTLTNENGRVYGYSYDANDNLVQTRDPAGYTVGYSYDLMDRRTNVNDSIGPIVSYTYDGMGRRTAVTDAAGNATTYVYDPRGWVTNVTRDGKSWSSTYDLEGVPTSRTSPLGYTTMYQTDRLGLVTGVVDALNHFYAYERDSMGRIVQTENPLGQVRTYSYDGPGDLVSMSAPVIGTASYERNGLGQATGYTDFEGRQWGYDYTPMGRLASATNALGQTTRFSYDSSGRLLQTDFPDGNHATYTYDNQGRVQTREDRAGYVRSYSYDHAGRLREATNPAAGVVSYTYNDDGTLATQTDTDVGVYSYSYDSLRRLETVTLPDGSIVDYGYDAFSRVTDVVDANGGLRHYEYDDDGRLTHILDPAGNETRYRYDGLNRLMSMTNRLGHTTRYEYDSLSRLTRRTDPEGVALQYTYDAANRLTGRTVGGQTWQYGYDNESRLTSLTTPSGLTTMLTRDDMGSVTGIVDAAGNTAALVRDSMQRITRVIDPLARTNSYSYEARGLLSGASNAISRTSYGYNNLGLLETLTDPSGEDWTFAYTQMGRIQQAADPLSRATGYGQDGRGRLSSVNFADTHAVAIDYDGVGNITNLVYTDGTAIGYEYDPLNRLSSTKGTTLDISLTYDDEGQVTATDNPGTVFGASYDNAGRLETATYSNGFFTATYTYDSAGRLTRVQDDLTGTAVDLAYDADRRLVGITRPNGVNTVYTLDDTGRLTRVQAGTVLDLRYMLDAAGQVTRALINAPLTVSSLLTSTTQSHTFDAAAQISTPGHTFDARGRQTAAPGRIYTWNAASHLVGVDLTTIGYNGLNDVATRSVGGADIHFYYNHAIGMTPIVAERDDVTGQMLRYYVWTPGGRLLYMIDAADGNKVYHYHFDRQGSTLALTDAGGDVTDSYAYAPYGALLAHIGANAQPFTFVGVWGVRQEGTGDLYHMRARYYDAVNGRFISKDPLWPILADVRTINPYQYAYLNPAKYIDPRGTDPHVEKRVERDATGIYKGQTTSGKDKFLSDGEVTFYSLTYSGEGKMRIPVKDGKLKTTARDSEIHSDDKAKFSGKEKKSDVRRNGKKINVKANGQLDMDPPAGVRGTVKKSNRQTPANTAGSWIHLPFLDFAGPWQPQFGGLSAPQFGGLSVPQFGGLSVPQFGGLSVPQFGGLSVPQITPMYGGIFMAEERAGLSDDSYLYGIQIAGEVAPEGRKAGGGVSYYQYENLDGFTPLFDGTDAFAGSIDGTAEDDGPGAEYTPSYSEGDSPLVNHNWSISSPLMVISPVILEETMNPNEWRSVPISITEGGSGPLKWTAVIEFDDPTLNGGGNANNVATAGGDKIFDFFDNEDYSSVDHVLSGGSFRTDTPISPPRGVLAR